MTMDARRGILVNKVLLFWENLRSSLWFVPALIVSGCVGLAVAFVEIDSLYFQELEQRWPRLFGVGAAGSRGMLTAIASSMITVVGVTFSITVVALALASNQYSPRILRNFMRDLWNQAVLGVLVGVFAYSLVVLRTVRGGDENTFVPSLAVLVAVLLAFVGIGFLIFFIHHIASSIQATTIIKGAADETLGAIVRTFPHHAAEQDDNVSRSLPDLRGLKWTRVRATKTGYVQGVQKQQLLHVACKFDLVVRMEAGTGDFVIAGSTIVSVAGIDDVDSELIKGLNEAYAVGEQRTVHQDPSFGIRQIVDIALKALSPSVNDTTTAVHCLDFLAAILVCLGERLIHVPCLYDEEVPRVLVSDPDFADFVGNALNQIRRSASGNVTVLQRMLEVIHLLEQGTDNPLRRQILREHADQVAETADRTIPAAYDRTHIHVLKARCFPGLAVQEMNRSDSAP